MRLRSGRSYHRQESKRETLRDGCLSDDSHHFQDRLAHQEEAQFLDVSWDSSGLSADHREETPVSRYKSDRTRSGRKVTKSRFVRPGTSTKRFFSPADCEFLDENIKEESTSTKNSPIKIISDSTCCMFTTFASDVFYDIIIFRLLALTVYRILPCASRDPWLTISLINTAKPYLKQMVRKRLSIIAKNLGSGIRSENNLLRVLNAASVEAIEVGRDLVRTPWNEFLTWLERSPLAYFGRNNLKWTALLIRFSSQKIDGLSEIQQPFVRSVIPGFSGTKIVAANCVVLVVVILFIFVLILIAPTVSDKKQLIPEPDRTRIDNEVSALFLDALETIPAWHFLAVHTKSSSFSTRFAGGHPVFLRVASDEKHSLARIETMNDFSNTGHHVIVPTRPLTEREFLIAFRFVQSKTNAPIYLWAESNDKNMIRRYGRALCETGNPPKAVVLTSEVTENHAGIYELWKEECIASKKGVDASRHYHVVRCPMSQGYLGSGAETVRSCMNVLDNTNKFLRSS